MPVPMKMPIKSRGLALYSWSKTPRVQTLQSLPRNTGASSSFSRFFLSGTSFQPGRLGAKITRPVSVSTAPGAPTPMPRTCERSRSHSSTDSLTHRAMRSITASTPRSALVLSLVVPLSSSLALKTPASIFVPPRSTPTKYSLLGFSGIRRDHFSRWPVRTASVFFRNSALISSTERWPFRM